MDLNQYLQQIRIDVVKKTIFINSKLFEFVYTAPKDILKPEFQAEYRYFGGLQCEFEVDSPDYKKLENKLCSIAEGVLEVLKNKS